MIKDSDFNKLKQLDRIEYLLKKKEIESIKEGDSYSLNAFLLIGAIGFVILFSQLLINNGDYEKAYQFINSSKYVFLVMGGLVGIGILYDITRCLIYFRRKKDLISEYFKVEVKK